MASRAAAAVPWYLAGGVSAANCIAAYQAIGADDYATSKVNLANSGTYDLTESNGAVSWDAGTGWSFVSDEENFKVLLTGIAPNTPLTLIIRFSGAESEALISGISADETTIILFHTNGSTEVILSCGGDDINVYEEVQSGVVCVSNVSAYIDGTKKGDYLDGTISGNELILPIGGLNLDGFYVSFNVSVQAVGVYDVAISDAQVSAISTAMAAL
jgi:hypothetical protein